MSKIVQSVEEAKSDQTYVDALKELLYQLADDDFIVSYRGSEWLGLAPHIEEDVAQSSITQNTMGHATMYYQILEELGEGTRDQVAHQRGPEAWRSSTYLAKVNGEGHYLVEPDYDWALAVVRNFLYETAKKIKLEALTNSSYEPLRDTAHKILMEQTYHLAHWTLWIKQLQDATEISQEKITARLNEAWNEFGDVLSLGSKANDIVNQGLITDEETLQNIWLHEVNEVLSVKRATFPACTLGNGRNGEYTEDLKQAMGIFTEVFSSNPAANW